MFEPLPEDLATALAGAAGRLGPYGRLHYRADVESTNDLALSLASAGAPEGTAVLADLQRQGRGRRGHGWFSPPEAGVYLSVIVRPARTEGGVPLLTIAAGVAMAEAVAAVSALPVELKWPNDLVIGRPWRKMGGVLAEAVTSGGHIDAVVVGTGINLRPSAYPPDLTRRATSIDTELGRAIERPGLVVELLARQREVMDLLHRGERSVVATRWERFAGPGLRMPVSWHEASGIRRGTAHGIDIDGALLVATDSGLARVVAGIVTWEGHDRG